MVSSRQAGVVVSERVPARSKGAEIVQRSVEAGASMVPVVGGAFAVALVTAMDWKLNQRRDDYLQRLADRLEELGERVDGLSPEQLAENQVFVDTMIAAAVSAQRTSEAEKIEALRNAVLNTALAADPDADAHAVMIWLVDRFTTSHLRFLVLWDDPPAWFASRGLTPPGNIMAGSRMLTAKAGLPELAGDEAFLRLIADDLHSAGLMSASMGGMVSESGLMSRLTTGTGRQLVRLISAPEVQD